LTPFDNWESGTPPNPPKALAYARQVKALAQKALDEASDVLEDTTTGAA
jgi:hypothetical protein